MEEKIIPEYPTYSITSTGFVKDLRTGELHNGASCKGYRRISLTNQSGKRTYSIHRLVALAFIENPNNFPEIDHINRNNSDNRVENLRWANDYIQSQNRGDQKNNTSGYKNIAIEDNYFRVVITRNKQVVARKRFQSLEEAIQYRDNIYNTM